MPTSTDRSPTAPELLYLLHGDPAELARGARGMRAADVAEALREPPARRRRPKVMAALPFDLAVQVFDEPELDAPSRRDHRSAWPTTRRRRSSRRCRPTSRPISFASCRKRERARASRSRSTRRRASALELLLALPAGDRGRHHDDGVRLHPGDVDGASRRSTTSARSGRAKETVYAIYVLDPSSGTLVHVVSLRDLMLGRARRSRSRDVGDRRAPLSVHAAAPTARKSRGSSPSTICSPCPSSTTAARARHRHGRRRDRRDRARADGGRAEVRRYGGARRAVHGDRLLAR